MSPNDKATTWNSFIRNLFNLSAEFRLPNKPLIQFTTYFNYLQYNNYEWNNNAMKSFY